MDPGLMQSISWHSGVTSREMVSVIRQVQDNALSAFHRQQQGNPLHQVDTFHLSSFQDLPQPKPSPFR